MATTAADLRRRLDLTEETDASDRRLDSLARLLAVGSGSICVAASVFNGKLIIASNNFFAGENPPRTGTRDNNIALLAIREIVSYFQKVANGVDPDPETRKKSFIKICEMAKSKPQDDPYANLLGNQRFEKLIGDLLSGKNLKISTFIKEYGVADADAASAYMVFHKLLRAFTKLEKSLASKRSSLDFSGLSDEYFQAFLSDPFILRAEKNQNVHAEVQILAELVRDVESSKISGKQDIYVGISKLCCLDCRVMMEESAELLGEKAITLEVRGHHDLSFKKGEGGWLPPSQFSEGYAAESVSSNPTMSFSIGYNSKIAADELRKFELGGRVYQSPGHSGSEQSPLPMGFSRVEEGVAGILRESLLNSHEALIKHGWSQEKIDDVLPVIMNLLKIKTFSDSLGIPLSEGADRSFRAILSELQETMPGFSGQNLKAILEDPILMGTVSAEYFGDVQMGVRENPEPSYSSFGTDLAAGWSSVTKGFEAQSQSSARGDIGELEDYITPQANIAASASQPLATNPVIGPEEAVMESGRKKQRIQSPPKK